MNKLRRIKVGLLTCILAVSCVCVAGCGGDDRDDIAAQLGSDNVSSDTDSDVNENLGGGNVASKLQYTVECLNGRKVTVDAEVEAASKDKMKVYSQTKFDMSDEALINYAKSIFDNGEFEIIKPYEVSNESELVTEKERLETLIVESGTEQEPVRLKYYVNNVEECLKGIDETKYVETESNKVLYDVSTYVEGSIWGQIDGEMWMLKVYYVAEVDSRGIILSPCNAPLYVGGVCGIDEGGTQNNKCDLQESEHLASETIERLGYTNMVVINTQQVIPEGGNATDCDGYCFTYADNFEGVGVAYCYDRCKISGKDVTADQEYISVYVTSDGIVSVNAGTTYEFDDVSSEAEVIMQFEQIDDIARARMEREFDGYSGVDITVKRVEFGYLTVTYDGARYSSVPVWVYYGSKSSDPAYASNPLLAVNALDGELIEFIVSY